MTELILTCIIKKEKTGSYSSLCPELDVASRGDTIEEAKKNLEEAVEGHLRTAEQEGMLNEILQMLGITKKDIVKAEHIIIPSFSSPFTIALPT